MDVEYPEKCDWDSRQKRKYCFVFDLAISILEASKNTREYSHESAYQCVCKEYANKERANEQSTSCRGPSAITQEAG
jgi:hypothetical protein